MKRIWVAGEALIDLLPAEGGERSVVGGGPANTARALANLGLEVSFIGGISSDEYGQMISDELSGVDLSLAHRSDLPTATASVRVDETGSARYEFKLAGTATFDFHRDWLPSGAPDLLHIGTLATVIEPGATELFSWASTLNAPIIFDPNIRPSVISDRRRCREAVEKWAGISSVIKLSDEDLEWLGYSSVADFFDLGASLVVVTHGSAGMSGYTSTGKVSVPGVRVEVIDTVGAGDTVGAIIVEGLARYGLEELLGNQLSTVLSRAARAAAITCTRPGAKPPRAHELI